MALANLSDDVTTISYMDQSNVTTPNATVDADTDYIRQINFILMGIVINVGLLCNVVALVVFGASKILRQTTTGNFLMSLTVADFLFMIGELLRWLHSTHSEGQFLDATDIMYSSEFACKGVYFLRYGSKLTSSWLTVAITTERFLTVACPLQISQISTLCKARVMILLTFVVSFILGAYPFWTVGIRIYEGNYRCMIIDRHAYDDWSWAILRVGSLLVPGIAMLVLTSLLVHSLFKARSNRFRNLLARHSANGSASHDIERQLTAMLLSVALAFIVLRLPYAILFYINEFKKQLWVPLDDSLAKRIYFATKMADVLATVNYAVNFFLYCMCGSTFRKQFKKLVTCKADPRRRRRSFTMSSLVPTSLRRSGRSNFDRHSVDRSHVSCHRLSNPNQY